MTTELILLLGGARSGKSRQAVDLATASGRPVVFLATGAARDEEMRDRIARHRQERPAGWRTIERVRNLGPAIAALPAESLVILDGLGDVATDYLLAAQPPGGEGFSAADLAGVEERVRIEVDGLVTGRQRSGCTLIVVSNEVGLGLVPPYPLGRHYRDILGRANQRLAAAAGTAVLLVAGLPLVLKGSWPPVL